MYGYFFLHSHMNFQQKHSQSAKVKSTDAVFFPLKRCLITLGWFPITTFMTRYQEVMMENGAGVYDTHKDSLFGSTVWVCCYYRWVDLISLTMWIFKFKLFKFHISLKHFLKQVPRNCGQKLEGTAKPRCILRVQREYIYVIYVSIELLSQKGLFKPFTHSTDIYTQYSWKDATIRCWTGWYLILAQQNLSSLCLTFTILS